MKFWDKIRETVSGRKDLATMGLANVVATIISTVFWFYVATIMTVSDYGEISYLIAIATITATVASLGALNTLIVYTAKEVKIQNPLFFVALIASIIASATIYFVFSSFATSLYVIGYVIFNLLTSEIIGRKLYGTFSKYLIIQRILTVALSLSLYYVLGPEGIVLGIALSFFAYAHKIFVALKQSGINLTTLKPYRGFMMNNYAFDITRTLVVYIDKLVIFPLFGLVTLGHYHLATQVLYMGIILPGTIFQYIVPQEASGSSIKNLKLVGVIISICIAVLTIIFTPFVFSVIFPQYSDSVEMIQIMILAIIPSTINLMYISKFLANEKNRVIVIGALIFISVQVFSLFTIGRMFDIYGIASSIVLAHTTESIYLFLMDKRTKWLEK